MALITMQVSQCTLVYTFVLFEETVDESIRSVVLGLGHFIGGDLSIMIRSRFLI